MVDGVVVPVHLIGPIISAVREIMKRSPGASCKQCPHPLVDHNRYTVKNITRVVRWYSTDHVAFDPPPRARISLSCSISYCYCLHFQGDVLQAAGLLLPPATESA